ncbi:hypothetical protein GWK08_17530 [Leptobacterium flavescens]|uniref:Nuclear transport factor 2 family protein n=1 Tax=Leptobacterium flavescens TaxID=472055 RepID=A0A6P0URV1_9FLAO|nr:hypothetical protein [Leptobacterium flavescens]NER15262.1 hypothetical protein [Leptobacterium flavescens]
MRKLCIVLIGILCLGNLSAQEAYKFIEEVYADTVVEKVRLNKDFMNILTDRRQKTLFEDDFVFGEFWAGGKTDSIPNLELFKEKIGMTDFLSYIDTDFENPDLKINFEQLSSKFEEIEDPQAYVEDHRDQRVVYISKPFFNASGDWAMILEARVWYGEDGDSGDTLRIFRKLNGKWQLFHNLTLSFL